MAELGFRTMAEMIGHVELLDTRAAVDHWKATGLDLARSWPRRRTRTGRRCYQSVPQDHGLADALDVELIRLARPAIDDGHAGHDRPADPQRQPHRRHAARPRGHQALEGRRPARRHDRHPRSPARPARASARSCPRGITMRLVGDANDYLGKGLSGGRLDRAPAADGDRSSPRTTSSPAT